MKNYFYLVGYQYDETFVPLKIFINKEEAINWGRNMATEWDEEYYLYAQEMSKEGRLHKIKTLTPYLRTLHHYLKKKTQPKQVVTFESFDWDAYDEACDKPVKGADFDIDVRRS